MSNRLPILAAQIREAHSATLRHAERAAEHALEAGAMLVEAKSLCPHGKWAHWLKEIDIPERTARRYMLLHRAGFKSAIVADLGFAKAEHYGSSGLAMIPDDGQAICAAGYDLDGEHRFGSLTYWWKEASGIIYWHVSFYNDEAFEVRPPGPLQPWLLAAVHENDRKRFDTYSERYVPLDEARSFLREFEGGAA